MIWPLFVAVGAVVMLVFLFQARRLAEAALGLGLTLEDAAVIFLSALPPFLVLAVPIAYLVSVLVGLGRLAIDRELVALRAAGAGPWRLARTPLALGVAVSALTLPLAMYGEPFGLRLLERRLVEVGLKNLSRAIQPGVFNEDFKGNAVFAAGRAPDGRLEDVMVFDERNRDRPVLVTARRGGFVLDPPGIRFLLSSGEMHLGVPGPAERYDRLRFETAELGLDAAEELTRRTRFVSPLGQMLGPEMRAAARRAGLHTPLGRRIEKTYWRRFAFPSMAFVFGVLATAIAFTGSSRARARHALWGVAAVVGYYALTRVGDLAVVKLPGTSFWGAWGPNLLALVVGGVALARSGRPGR